MILLLYSYTKTTFHDVTYPSDIGYVNMGGINKPTYFDAII